MSSEGEFVLRLKVQPEMKEMYIEAANKHNQSIKSSKYFDAGFDLFCPEEISVNGFTTVKIDQGVKGSMEFCRFDVDAQASVPVGYFMYPRSSTGSKTPLRLANSIGVIDSGYRGNYIAVFDNCRSESFNVERLQRLVQICPPNLTYSMKVLIVDDLGEATSRGTGGFGSTGS